MGSTRFRVAPGWLVSRPPTASPAIGQARSRLLGLSQITIPDRSPSLGDNAFSGCISLANVTIPKSVKNIGDFAFSDCPGLAEHRDSHQRRSIWRRCVCGLRGPGEHHGSQQRQEPRGGAFSVRRPGHRKISARIQAVGTGVFADCASLTNVGIPGSVISIGGTPFPAYEPDGHDHSRRRHKPRKQFVLGLYQPARMTIPNRVKRSGITPSRAVQLGQRNTPRQDHQHRRLYVPGLHQTGQAITIPDEVTRRRRLRLFRLHRPGRGHDPHERNGYRGRQLSKLHGLSNSDDPQQCCRHWI